MTKQQNEHETARTKQRTFRLCNGDYELLLSVNRRSYQIQESISNRMQDWLTDKAASFISKRLKHVDPKVKQKLATALQEESNSTALEINPSNFSNFQNLHHQELSMINSQHPLHANLSVNYNLTLN
ncbi:hypothetical protein GJ496_006970 [Pomphorhynchus laevis]|nr:hypothetical protein GJ496_006970 [Pomphorhynchus laevis]